MSMDWKSMNGLQYVERNSMLHYLESEFLATPDEAKEMRQAYLERLRTEHLDSSVCLGDCEGDDDA